jgi:hypothetical protein
MTLDIHCFKYPVLPNSHLCAYLLPFGLSQPTCVHDYIRAAKGLPEVLLPLASYLVAHEETLGAPLNCGVPPSLSNGQCPGNSGNTSLCSSLLAVDKYGQRE